MDLAGIPHDIRARRTVSAGLAGPDRRIRVNDLGILTLDPILVPKPWGGRRLARSGKTPLPAGPATARYGESWEVADLPDGVATASESGRTRVADGPHRGKTVRRLISERGAALLGSASPTPAGDFPLLFKLLDTTEHLSIQVHPDRALAATRPGWMPKTESWYVLHAEPGAVIFKGLLDGVEKGDVRSAAGTPRMADLMNRVETRRGDFHHLPAGTVHALGAGITVAEVQTPSDTTFRLYDWTEEYDRPPRPLHTGPAVEALLPDPPGAQSRGPMEAEGRRLLVDTPHYWIREHLATDGPLILREAPEMRIMAVARGRVEVAAGPGPLLRLGSGATVVVPATVAPSTRVAALRIATLLEIGLRSEPSNLVTE